MGYIFLFVSLFPYLEVNALVSSVYQAWIESSDI